LESPISVLLYRDGELVYSTKLEQTIEFGRQRGDEPKPYSELRTNGHIRVIVGSWNEAQLSRKHCLLETTRDAAVEVTNASSGCTLLYEPNCEAPSLSASSTESTLDVEFRQSLPPNQQVRLQPPFAVSLGPTTLQVTIDEEPATGLLLGLETRSAPPGSLQSPLADISALLSARDLPLSIESTPELPLWLDRTMAIFQRSATSDDFLPHAAKAVLQTVGLDAAAILTRTGDGWKIETVVSGDEASEVSLRPSRTILQRVLQEKRTFRQLPDEQEAVTESLRDISALVAAPILDVAGEVIGVVYGDKKQNLRSTRVAEVTPLEAKLVELLASAVAAGLARLEQEKKALASRIQFEQFFSPELSRELTRDPELLKGRDAEVTLLFGDIRGFSRISERMGPEGTVEWINSMLGALSECVSAENGVLVDYVGDELFAMWGAPANCEQQAARACRAAIEMQDCLKSINAKWQGRTGEPIGLGIGVNTGIARVGNIGSHKKFKYGPLGNAVNLASRLQGATKQLRTPILVAAQTAAKLDPDEFALRRLCKLRVVNIAGAVDAYELSGQLCPEQQHLKSSYEEALSAFENADFHVASKLLGSLITQYPDDGPSILLLSRAVNQLAHPSSGEFDPVWELTEK